MGISTCMRVLATSIGKINALAKMPATPPVRQWTSASSQFGTPLALQSPRSVARLGFVRSLACFCSTAIDSRSSVNLRIMRARRRIAPSISAMPLSPTAIMGPVAVRLSALLAGRPT